MTYSLMLVAPIRLFVFFVMATSLLTLGLKAETLKITPIAKSPTIDGAITAEEWADAVRVSLDKQTDPQEGAVATEKTEVYLAYDKNHL